MRLRRRKDTTDYLQNEKQCIVLDPTAYKGRWHEFFNNDHPIHVELGMGKGSFVSNMSHQHPHINYIGIDLYDELIRKASERAHEVHGDEVKNLGLVMYNIEELEHIFASSEIDHIYLNFSDPWPKKRHAKRRLTHPDFLQKYRDVLRETGTLQLRTDSETLFEFSLNSFASTNMQLSNISLNLHRDEEPENHVYTEYEKKFVSQGKPIYQCQGTFAKHK
ncbi:tRNA (guanosine(46)-N7)-methyltransferase TrmB [Longirhabdus pacifica]|uniref:tRNA (guanosine(46)-N7)-methyltransferase TrmB n=1 Tax=Longirhabdus pacifica TaxID=2305227 RepID=UPI001008AE12|nr:tRNA (guanosine(46)-N7)-methyltransferase TrmB [Longirhabdus pacifica]